MKQILLSSAGAILARVPRPAVVPGCVLVEVHHSLISVGTELAPLRATALAGDTGEPAGPVPSLVRRAPYYLGKAVQHPDVAWMRLKQISRSYAAAMRERLVPAPAPAAARSSPPDDALVVSQNPVPGVWHKEAASQFQVGADGISVTAGGAPGHYQAMSGAITVENDGYLQIHARGEVISGGFDLGVLSADRSQWLAVTRLDGVMDERIVLDPGTSSHVWLVLSLGDTPAADGGAARLRLDELTLQALPRDSYKPPRNEMNDVGWNVGYSASGRVVAVGEGVADIRIGDRVACGGAGQANHAELICVRRNLVARLPEKCTTEIGATTTVGAIAMQGVRRADLRLGEVVCVVGLGLLGLITCELLKASGCHVLGLDLSGERVSRAKGRGIEAVSSSEQLLHLALHKTLGHGADATIITAASKSDALINHAMKTTRRKGRVVIVGDIGLNMERPELYRKEIDVLISTSYGPGRYDPSYEIDGVDYPYAYVRWTQNRNMQAYLDLVADGAIDIAGLIDEVVDLDGAPVAYERLARDAALPAVGVLIRYPASDRADASAPAPGPAETVLSLGGHRRAKPGSIGYVLVGAGAFGQAMLVPQMDRRKGLFDLRGVVSRDAVRGGNFARQRQLEILASDMDDVLKRDDIQLVVIATRHADHARQTAQALRAGKHVFVEKPLALSWEELDLVREAYAARPAGTLLMVGFNRRFAPAAEMLRDRIASRVGPLVVTYRLNGGYIPRDSWVQGAEGGGRNLGEACHMYDFFRSLAGAPVTSISASAIDPGRSAYFVNDNFVATLTYADGSVASLIYTANGPRADLPKERVEVYCDGKAYVLDNFTALTEYPGEAVIWRSDDPDKGHFTQLSRFGDAIAAGAADAPIPFYEIAETTAASLHIEDLLQGRV